MDRLSMLVTGKYSNSIQKEKPYKNLSNSQSSIIKYIMSLLGKGTGNGQAIRDEILVIMHKNKIPESNSNFYEQWHQKLHNNTTPDDIVICEALLAFLYSGNIEDYRNTLKRGGITKERMASYERKIIAEPWHNSSYIPDFERYLKILKSVHASTDLIQTYEQCKYLIGNNSKLDDIINNKDDKDVLRQLKRVTEGREELQGIIRNNINDWGKLRDVLFFELSLEIYMRQLVERIIHIQINYQTYIYEISLVLRNIKVSYPNFSEFNICLDDWFNVVEKLKNNNDFSKTGMLKVKSVVSRLNRLLSNVIDFYNQNFEGRAKFFGKECGVDNYYSSMFAEELMRGSIFFALSMLLKKIEPTIRKCAQLGDWLIISRGKNNKVRGMVKHVKNLHDVQFMKYPEKTIILTEAVSGNEEIPINCVCLIIIKSENYPDILAHVSVRARNLDVPFAVCFNEQRANDMLKLINKNGEVNFENQEVIFKESNEIINQDTNKENLENNTEEIKKVQVVKTGDKYKKIYLELDEFEKNVVGAKSNNTQKLFGKVPGCDWLKYPESFAIPFNVHEYFLSLDKNKEIAEEIEEYIQKISNAIKKETISELLLKCRNLTLELNFVENEETLKLKKKLIDFGIKSDDLNLAFKAIKSVWASKFNERAYIATSKVGITLKDIRMAVLCQKIIPAEYAYVIHTKNPSNNNSDEVFAEVCVGMGEALVGAYEGQSLSFAYNKKSKTYDIKSFPNKSIALKNSGFIFRSDSNTEDLEGFSGAGLFDSVPMIEDREEEVCYHKDKIFYDEGFRDYLIKKIGELGIGVENMYGGLAQDIEGVFYNNNFYIVQTRPQV
jgi:alpha-glucan,water dikinase